MVNCYVVEGRNGLVAIDSALTVSDSKALRAKVDALGKPLRAILLTHGHPDHYNGVVYLMEGKSVPVYATARVAKVIRDWDGAKEKQWKPVFGAEWPPQRKFADHEAQDGDKLTFDELEFVVHDLGPGESYADSYWELTSPVGAAFIGDEVLNGSHAYTNDGHTADWIKNLDRLSRALKGVKRVFPGHGSAGDTSLFNWEKQYLTKYRKEVEALHAGRDKLSDEQKKTLVERMKAAYPSAGNEFMIALGADAVAAELEHAHSTADHAK
ncbi:MAG TPA: MBL fold metallo-hydrolase [Candidatus Acidoferrales bacterium]|nr:MBL fold metallo-hydrolase [Candidatus Acidoferrales bacterium]HKD40181.1 MBL fold metallo-hydrolase [Myxococcaceae bacterium]